MQTQITEKINDELEAEEAALRSHWTENSLVTHSSVVTIARCRRCREQEETFFQRGRERAMEQQRAKAKVHCNAPALRATLSHSWRPGLPASPTWGRHVKTPLDRLQQCQRQQRKPLETWETLETLARRRWLRQMQLSKCRVLHNLPRQSRHVALMCPLSVRVSLAKLERLK